MLVIIFTDTIKFKTEYTLLFCFNIFNIQEPRVIHFGNKIKVTLYIFMEQDVMYMILYVLNNIVGNFCVTKVSCKKLTC